MILLRIALRNLGLHKFKSALVGTILLLGTALVVVGNGVLDAVDQSMAVSLVNSVTGHVQVYSADSKDEFAIFGNMDGSQKDIGHLSNFPEIRKTLEALPEVDTVIPMGIDNAIVFTGNMLDRKLAELRELADAKQHTSDRALVVMRHVRRIVERLKKDLDNIADITDVERLKKESGEDLDVIALVTPEFWSGWTNRPYEILEFLENKVAKLALGEDMIWVRYIGTDTERFAKTFDRFEIVEGERIPPGRRGFLFNERSYDRFVKNKTAYRLDRILEKVDDGETYSSCDDCETWTKLNVKQARSLVDQLDETAEAEVRQGLQKHLGSKKTSVTELLEELLDVSEANFRERYAAFYEIVAPRIVLYTINIGDTFVLTAFGRGGYVRKVPVKVYGTFRFRSLDRSPLAGGFNVMDMLSFRDLYGYMTQERKQEIEDIRKDVGVEDVSAADAEEALFGADADVEDETKATAFDATEGIDMKAGGERYTAEVFERTYSQEEIEDGVVLNAAVMFTEGVELEDGVAAIRKANDQAGLGIQLATWREAAGLVGEFIGVIRIVLYAAVFIIFVVALIIINNSMMMSTLERTREIGTMRAIGAQRSFVRKMILIETGILAVVFGGLGSALGAGAMLWMGKVGVPAWSDVTYFLFAGPRLHPALAAEHLLVAFLVIVVVGLASTLYPAMLATGVTPREAMAKDD